MKQPSLKKKICAITGTRADYGILKPVLKKILESSKFELQIIATGMHLEEKFGYTLNEITSDGFEVNQEIYLDLSSDLSCDVTKAMGRGLIKFADSLEALKPDLILVLGDRFEILVAAQAALLARIPIAHISGGDVTQGAIDDSMRHAITKMAHIHFVTNEEARRRVIQLGEAPKYVFNFGNPSLDHIHTINFLNKEELEEEIGFKFLNKNLIVTFHPETIQKASASQQIDELLGALDFYQTYGIIFTMPNADPGNFVISEKIEFFCKNHPNAKSYISLGYKNYMNVLTIVDVIVGNSSSGILEAPSFNLPCVNIGIRQSGRLQSTSTINVPIEMEKIKRGIDKAIHLGKKLIDNPYGDGHSSEKIIRKLEEIHNFDSLLNKKFYDQNLAQEEY